MNKKEKQLLAQFRSLSDADANTLLDFAEFLAARQPAPEIPQTVNKIERPAEEKVVAAIKRLTTSYPMLDKAQILNETSALMAQHMLQGKPAKEVIDELEAVFERHYVVLQEQAD